MKGHIRRVRRRDAGFSFVELLVTIIIAGVIFAAMVPVFASALKKNSSDLFRDVALNAAQDRIEKVRSLDYKSISETNLTSSSFANGIFGTSAPASTGSSRTLAVSYKVTNYPAGSNDTTSKYKTVSVRVSWTAPPSPVKPVVVQTVIYRQYAGPAIIALTTDPGMDESGVLGDSHLTTVTFGALPSQAWLTLTQSVQFSLWDSGGTLVAQQTVARGDTSSPTLYGVDINNRFWWNWDSTPAIDGVYKISATASDGTNQGPTEEFYFKIQRGDAPDAPAGLVAVAGSREVSLTWQSVPNAVSYRVFRGASAAGPWTTIASPATQSFTDSGLADATTYYYTVCAVNAAGRSGAKAAAVMATTAPASADVTAPSIPGNLVATGDSPTAGVIHLTWTASSDAESGMLDYQIYRSDTGALGSYLRIQTWLFGNGPQFDDTVGSGVTRYYYVVARDVALNASAASNVAFASTAAIVVRYTLTLRNINNGQDNYAWVQCATSGPNFGLYYREDGTTSTTAPSGVVVPRKGGTVVWSSMPPGTYNIWVNSKSALPANPQTSVIISTANVTQTIN